MQKRGLTPLRVKTALFKAQLGGTDIEAVARFLDAPGAKVHCCRCAKHSLPLCTSMDMMHTDVSLFAARGHLQTTHTFAQGFNKLIRCYKYPEKGFEDEVKTCCCSQRVFQHHRGTNWPCWLVFFWLMEHLMHPFVIAFRVRIWPKKGFQQLLLLSSLNRG